MQGMEYLSLRIPRRVKEWLESVAKKSGISISSVVRTILEAEVRRAESTGARGLDDLELFALSTILRSFVKNGEKMTVLLRLLRDADPEGFERALKRIEVSQGWGTKSVEADEKARGSKDKDERRRRQFTGRIV